MDYFRPWPFPRFLDITEQAEDATVEGINAAVDQDTGYPRGLLNGGGNYQDTVITALDCESIFSLIMQSALSITSSFSESLFDG